MIIVLDLDNTTLDYDGMLARYVLEATGRQVPTNRPFSSYEQSGWFSCQESWLATHTEAVLDGELARQDPYPGAVEALRALHDLGATVKVATFRGILTKHRAKELADTENNLVRLGIPFDELHFVRDKWTVPGDVWVEDSVSVVTSLSERGLPAVVYDQEYNRSLTSPRATSWAGLYDLLTATR